MSLTGFPPEGNRDCRMQDILHLDARSIEVLFFYLRKENKLITSSHIDTNSPSFSQCSSLKSMQLQNFKRTLKLKSVAAQPRE